MSKLTEKTVQRLLHNICKTEDPHYYHPMFDRILREGHPLNDISQRRMILWGHHRHVEKVLDQPKMTQSTVGLAHSEIQLLPDADVRRKLRNKIEENFPDMDYTLPDNHVHTNTNPKVK